MDFKPSRALQLKLLAFAMALASAMSCDWSW